MTAHYKAHPSQGWGLLHYTGATWDVRSLGGGAIFTLIFLNTNWEMMQLSCRLLSRLLERVSVLSAYTQRFFIALRTTSDALGSPSFHSLFLTLNEMAEHAPLIWVIHFRLVFSVP